MVNDPAGRQESKVVGRFGVRRVPGTLALAVANIIAADVLRHPLTFTASPIHSVNIQLMPARVWGALWLIAAIGLLVAVATRRRTILHLFSGLSLAVWSAATFGVLTAWLTGAAQMTASGLALLWWMWAGASAMIVVPLIAESKPPTEEI